MFKRRHLRSTLPPLWKWCYSYSIGTVYILLLTLLSGSLLPAFLYCLEVSTVPQTSASIVAGSGGWGLKERMTWSGRRNRRAREGGREGGREASCRQTRIIEPGGGGGGGGRVAKEVGERCAKGGWVGVVAVGGLGGGGGGCCWWWLGCCGCGGRWGKGGVGRGLRLGSKGGGGGARGVGGANKAKGRLVGRRGQNIE